MIDREYLYFLLHNENDMEIDNAFVDTCFNQYLGSFAWGGKDGGEGGNRS